MKSLQYILLLSGAALLWQCEPAIDEFKPAAGQADFTTFVSIGDSYSAGYTDGALGYEGQVASFPNIIAGQLKTVGMQGEFKQPLTAVGSSVGTTTIDAKGNKNGFFVLKYNVDSTAIAPSPTAGDMTIFTTFIGSQAPFNNVAVPGAKSIHLVTPQYGDYTLGTGNYNPFYSRFASNPGTSTIFSDGMAAQPTFVSLWIGGNDVLAYALAGGEGTVGGNGATDITATSTFEYVINSMFSTLKAAGIEGVTGNIPNINTLPYFTTVPFNGLVLSADQATALNTGYAGYNALAQSKGWPTLTFVEGANGFVVEDKLGYLRHAVSTDKILLSALSYIQGSTKWGSATSIGSEYVLDATEVAAIDNATTAFNEILESKATEYGLAFANLNQLMNEIVAGKIIDGATYSSAFVSGNIFSLDGIHATPRGSAIIANEFIEAINSKYGASVPKVDINDYRTNLFP
jgi:lysophospholipase L1-like esterase